MSSVLPGRLCLVATPIGHLEDITLRALQALKTADLIAAEDTRQTQKLLNHYHIQVPVVSYYKDVERRRTPDLLQRLLSGKTIALVTDAGTPGISDPGAYLVRNAWAQGIMVEVLPGPSAVITALAGSGLPADQFSFHGFLDTKTGARRKSLEALKHRPETQVFFITPHRLLSELEDILICWGDREAALCREMTKHHEERRQGKLSEIMAACRQNPPRGEYTLVVAGCTQPAPEQWTETLPEHLQRLQNEGLSLNQAAGRVARERGISRSQVYALAHKIGPKEN